MEPFRIVVRYSRDSYRLDCRLVKTGRLERYEVKAKNHTFLLECNRPALTDAGLAHIPWNWIVVSEEKIPLWFYKELLVALEKYIRDYHYALSKRK